MKRFFSRELIKKYAVGYNGNVYGILKSSHYPPEADKFYIKVR